jgi:hypothetical protein
MLTRLVLYSSSRNCMMIVQDVQVRINGQMSPNRSLINGLKQESVFAPCFYNIFMGAIMKHVDSEYAHKDIGIPILLYNPNAVIFDPTIIDDTNTGRILKQVTYTIFADDLVLFSPTAQQLQSMLNIFIVGISSRVKRCFKIKVDPWILNRSPLYPQSYRQLYQEVHL